jgi:alkylated DNA repair dioxygenase AlkB
MTQDTDSVNGRERHEVAPGHVVLTRLDGEMILHDAFLSDAEATALFTALLANLPWAEEHFTMFGKTVNAPRLVSWHGDPGAVYTYSGVRHEPHAWTPELLVVRQRIEALTRQSFNSVLANLYRSERDSMGWHADKEKELGEEPFIASLSLGAERLFRARHNKTKMTVDTVLRHGSLLTMGGAFQRHWRHCVPKSHAPVGARINLTFRRIVTA